MKIELDLKLICFKFVNSMQIMEIIIKKMLNLLEKFCYNLNLYF